MELVTGKRGFDHFSAAEFREMLTAMFGNGNYLFEKSGELKAELVSNNLIKIHEGTVISEGCIFKVNKDTYDEITIENGAQGVKRIDLIAAHYSRDAETGVETLEWNVIKGTPAAQSPQVPAYTKGSIAGDDSQVDIPVFEVHIDGLQVTEIVPLISKKTSDTSSLAGMFETRTVQLINKFTTYPDRNPAEDHFNVFKIGNLVFLSVVLDRKQEGSESLPAFILPEGFRPIYTYDIKNVDKVGYGWIRTWSGEFMTTPNLTGKFDISVVFEASGE